MSETYDAKLIITRLGEAPREVPGAVAQVDLKVLATALAPRLADPDSAFTEGVAIRPDPANPTAGPHRYTIYVPHNDGSRVNIGAPHPVAGETGIALETMTHVHTWAWGPGHATYMSLGAPPVSRGADNNKKTTGYSLFTLGASSTVVFKEIAIQSLSKGMALTAFSNIKMQSEKANVDIASGGSTSITADMLVNISAGKESPIPLTVLSVAGAVVLTAADAADFLAPVAGHKSERAEKQGGAAAGAVNFFLGEAIENDAAKLRDQWMAKSSSVIDKTLTHLTAVITIFMGYKKTKKEAVEGKGTWKVKTAWGGWIMSILAELNAFKGEFGADNTEGDVNIKATKKIMLDAAGGVSITGAKGVSVNGFKGASLSGLTASVKGHKEGAVWGGLGASLKALAGGITISSDLKGVEITGKKDVKIVSEAAKASLTGELDAQLNSVGGKTLIHSPSAVHVVSGTGDGFGMVAKAAEVSIGAVTSAKEFAGAATDPGKTSAVFNASMITMQNTADNKITLSKSAVIIKAKQAGVNSSGKIYLKGSIVELN